MVNVPLSFPRAARDKGWWIQSTSHEGIRVVEQPLGTISHDDTDQSAHVMGSATVLVDPGATLDVDTLAGAWAVGAPTEKQIALCAEGAKVAARASRAIADSDQSMTGLGVGEDGERVLAVKMSDKCPHEETNWNRTPCGHN